MWILQGFTYNVPASVKSKLPPVNALVSLDAVVVSHAVTSPELQEGAEGVWSVAGGWPSLKSLLGHAAAVGSRSKWCRSNPIGSRTVCFSIPRL